MSEGTADGRPRTAGDRVECMAALRDVPGVYDAVLVDRIADGQPTTIGYLSGAALPTTAELRQRLLSRLPPDLVPEHLVVLDELPLTPEGDYDLDLLPDPPSSRTAQLGYVAPRNPLEQQLADTVRSILGVDRVGVHDSFFALGGSSLQATFLTTRIRELFDVELSLQDMFVAPTVDEVAGVVARTLGERAGARKLEQSRRTPQGMWLALHAKLPLRIRRILPPGVPCGGSPGDGKRQR